MDTRDETSITARVARGLIDCTLPKPHWTHEAHLRAGLWHVLQHGADQALALLRARIRAYNVATGGANTEDSGYHETITQLYVTLMGEFAARVDASLPPDLLAARLLPVLGARDLPQRFYSRERLHSAAARAGYVPPDLAPVHFPWPEVAAGQTRPLILDGGTGRELARQGAPFRQPEWSALALLEGPEFVSRVHQAYLMAGADVISTNSYAVVPFHLGDERFAAEGARLAALAGRLAREAVQSFLPAQPAARRPVPRVAGSLPPVCGSYRADLFDAEQGRPVLQVLTGALAPHVDLWLAETLSTTAEAHLVREVLGHDARPLWLSFTLQDGDEHADRPRLRSGETVADAVQAALLVDARALLFNCSQPEVMAAAVQEARRLLLALQAPIPIGVYANAFPPQPAEAEANAGLDPIRADLTPAGYCRFATHWWALGATLVGGCCGIGPEHIAALRAAADGPPSPAAAT